MVANLFKIFVCRLLGLGLVLGLVSWLVRRVGVFLWELSVCCMLLGLVGGAD